ncbi:hypothetical protein BH20ACT18_BH20ACT18_12500 [soil metagenome]
MSREGEHLTPACRRWYHGLPAVTAEVDCGGKAHRITWRRGKLVLEDHDLLAERSLSALGAKPALCVEVLEAWRAMRGSEHLHDLLLRDRTLSPEELARMKAGHELVMKRTQERPGHMRAALGGLGGNPPRAAEMLSQIERQAAEGLERQERVWAITLIDALPPALRRALALSVIVSIERRWDDDEFRREHAKRIEPALTAIAAPLFEQSVRRWRRNLKPYAGFVSEAWLLAPGEQPGCAAWADSGGAHAALSLPLSWFTEVWARGIAVVDDCFVLAVAGSSRDGMTLRGLALRWERQDRDTSRSVKAPALLTRGNGGDWRLRWL